MNQRSVLMVSLLVLSMIMAPMMVLAGPQPSTGALYMYYYPSGDIVETETHGTYVVNQNTKYTGAIVGIEVLPAGSEVVLSLGYTKEDGTAGLMTIGTYIIVAGEGGNRIDFILVTPEDGKICTTATFHYSLVSGGKTYIAEGVISQVGHIHFVLPEFPIGALGAVTSAFLGLALYKKKSQF